MADENGNGNGGPAPEILHSYGWMRDCPDQRDRTWMAATPLDSTALPSQVDFRPALPEVYDQSSLGSCSAQAIGAACHYLMMRDEGVIPGVFRPSRLHIYYNERLLEGTTSFDAGAQLRDGIKAIRRWGFCDETLWPYDISKFSVRPPAQTYLEAMKEKVTAYARVPQNLVIIKQALVKGIPIVFGFGVYESFESASVAATGNMPMPRYSERMLGGHAVMLVGYLDDMEYGGEKGFAIVRNSWGFRWGSSGYFFMPYRFLLSDNCADFWAILGVP